MPLALPQVDEKTFKKLSKQIHRGLQARATGALGVSLNQLREAMAQAMGHGSVHGARQGWDHAPMASSLTPLIEVPPQSAPAPSIVAPPPELTSAELPAPPTAWTEALASLEKGEASFVSWALAHPDQFNGLRWVDTRSGHQIEPIGLASVLITQHGKRGWKALKAALDALGKLPEAAWWTHWEHLVLAHQDSQTPYLPKPFHAEMGRWFGRLLPALDIDKILARMDWSKIPQATWKTDPRTAFYQTASRRKDVTVSQVNLPPIWWRAAAQEWDSIFSELSAHPTHDRQAGYNHDHLTFQALYHAWEQRDVEKVTRVLSLNQLTAKSALRWLEKPAEKPLAEAVLNHWLEQDEGRDWFEVTAMLGAAVTHACWDHLPAVARLILEQEKGCPTMIGYWIGACMNASNTPQAYVAIVEAFRQNGHPHGPEVWASAVKTLWMKWVDGTTGFYGEFGGDLGKPMVTRLPGPASDRGRVMVERLSWIQEQGWQPPKEDKVWTAWMHATAFDPAWWPQAVRMGAPVQGVRLASGTSPSSVWANSPRPAGFLAAGLWEDCLSWEEVEALLAQGVRVEPDDVSYLVERILVPSEETDPEVVWAGWLDVFHVPQDRWKHYYGHLENLDQLVRWNRIAGGKPGVNDVANWCLRERPEALAMLDYAQKAWGLDLNKRVESEANGHETMLHYLIRHSRRQVGVRFKVVGLQHLSALLDRGLSVTGEDAKGQLARTLFQQMYTGSNQSLALSPDLPDLVNGCMQRLALAEAQERNQQLQAS